MAVDNVNPEGGEDWPHSATMGYQDNNTSVFDFHIDQVSSPLPEPGPSHVSHIHQVFKVAHSESDGESEGEGEGNKLEHNEDTHFRIWLDVASEDDKDDEGLEIELEDPRLTQWEGAHLLGVEQELDDLGTYKICLPFTLGLITLIQLQDHRCFP
jgi:hypothetical protein